jgi:hypothetical protein
MESQRGGHVTKDLESTLGSASGRLVILVKSPVLGSYLPHIVAASKLPRHVILFDGRVFESADYIIVFQQASHS